MMIKVLLVEDQAMVRGALRALLDLEKDIRVVATACNGREALEICDNCSPDLVVSDIEMPGMTGLELAE
ncbi:response regulator transcription factor [Microbulbifer sp. CNSA002]|uniref:response regulator transcription factor n=1 Tax=Microbulbifer sp. CNSA002 TaxID=3373604 RepID=UPI0039B4E64A